MAGSGTVLRTISSLGYNGIGVDIDPLAVLMSSAWTSPVNKVGFLRKVDQVLKGVDDLGENCVDLPWIDQCEDTQNFISFWFAKRQISELRKLSFIVANNQGKYVNLLKVALSKLIITKSKGASLAADVSHSRPHKMREFNDFEVISEYKKACERIAKIMIDTPPKGKIKMTLGDARKLKIKTNTVDAIITSPPYLNAIDYMRGHKLALVWLGHKINDLSLIRGTSVGAEKAPEESANIKLAKKIVSKIKGLDRLPNRKINMIHRYALDMYEIIRESSRVLKRNGRATFVIGNTTQEGVYIENTSIASEAAKSFGLELIDFREREIPQNRRYLPPPTSKELSGLKKRMRTEAVMTFIKS